MILGATTRHRRLLSERGTWGRHCRADGEGLMQNFGNFSRLLLAAVSLAAGLIFSTEAMAQALNFRLQFTGNMSCMQPVHVSNAPIGGSGSGVLNPDGSVSAEITQSLLMFSTSLHFDSKLGSGVTSVPGGTGQVRVAGRQSLRFIWN